MSCVVAWRGRDGRGEMPRMCLEWNLPNACYLIPQNIRTELYSRGYKNDTRGSLFVEGQDKES